MKLPIATRLATLFLTVALCAHCAYAQQTQIQIQPIFVQSDDFVPGLFPTNPEIESMTYAATTYLNHLASADPTTAPVAFTTLPLINIDVNHGTLRQKHIDYENIYQLNETTKQNPTISKLSTHVKKLFLLPFDQESLEGVATMGTSTPFGESLIVRIPRKDTPSRTSLFEETVETMVHELLHQVGHPHFAPKEMVINRILMARSCHHDELQDLMKEDLWDMIKAPWSWENATTSDEDRLEKKRRKQAFQANAKQYEQETSEAEAFREDLTDFLPYETNALTPTLLRAGMSVSAGQTCLQWLPHVQKYLSTLEEGLNEKLFSEEAISIFLRHLNTFMFRTFYANYNNLSNRFAEDSQFFQDCISRLSHESSFPLFRSKMQTFLQNNILPPFQAFFVEAWEKSYVSATYTPNHQYRISIHTPFDHALPNQLYVELFAQNLNSKTPIKSKNLSRYDASQPFTLELPEQDIQPGIYIISVDGLMPGRSIVQKIIIQR